jgi:hypothetical protein
LKPLNKETKPAVSATSTDLLAQTLEQLEAQEIAEKSATTRRYALNKPGRRTRAPDEAWARLGNLKTSVKKLNLVAKLIRGLTYSQAVTQLKLCSKRNAHPVLKLLESCRYNAENNHNLDVNRLIVCKYFI